MPELQTMESPKKVGFVNSSYSRHRNRIEEDEKELEELEAKPEEEEEKVEATKEEVENKDLSREEQSFKKRYGDVRRHMQQKEKEWESKFTALEARLGQENIRPPKSDEDIDAWASQYPDVAAIVETIAIKKAREQQAGLQDKVKEIDAMRESATRDRAEVELLKVHPDFGEIRDSDEFHDWADEQPKWVQDALYENENDARSASRAIDLYKSDMNIKTKKPSNTKDAAKSVNTRNTRSQPDAEANNNKLSESRVNKMTTKEYEKHQDEIMEAIRGGNFIYDISGSAR